MMNYGVAYYPEHWGNESIDNDARLMSELKFNVVRMGEFAWTKISPDNKTLNLKWLNEAIDMFSKYEIKTIMCTPTACPPKYLMDKYPDIYSYDDKGIRRNFGSRRSYCFNSKSLLKASKDIVHALGSHYSTFKNVIAWQIDNELGGDSNTRCYCQNCREKFQIWIQNKYNTIEELNMQWGTDVWSQTYRSFNEIEPPMYTNTVKNPSACLDYKRFCSDSAIEFMNQQVKIIKGINPSWKVTTNCFGIDADIDYKKLSQSLDYISWDDYPNLTLEKTTPYRHALGLDAMRGHMGKEFCCMETQTGTPGGDILFQTPRPGDMRKWVLQSIAHGANSILYFRWRTNYMGAEQYWHGIINHDGVPRRLFAEAKQISLDILKLEEFCNQKQSRKTAISNDENPLRAEVAIVFSQDVSWAFDIQPLIVDYSYIEHIKKYYHALFDNNISIDVISSNSDYSKYKLIIFPNFLFVNDLIIDKIKVFTSLGGTIITDFRSFVKEFNNKIIRSILPCGLNDILGIETLEYGIISKFENVKISCDPYSGFACDWYEMITLKSAKELANYECEDYYNKYPVITKNVYGSGNAYYLASTIDDELLYNVTKNILQELKIFPEIDAPKGVEVIKKKHMGVDVIFIINHTKIQCKIPIRESYINILTGCTESDSIIINTNDVVILGWKQFKNQNIKNYRL